MWSLLAEVDKKKSSSTTLWVVISQKITESITHEEEKLNITIGEITSGED